VNGLLIEDALGISPDEFYGPEVLMSRDQLLNWNDRQWVITSQFETENERIITYLNRLSKNYITLRYYNSTEEKLIEEFHYHLSNSLYWLIDHYNNGTLRTLNMIFEMDSEGLAIFRNLLYARYNYRFKRVYWYNFFSKYLYRYNGLLNEEDSLSRFTRRERELLEMIISWERQQ
jgi:hypothetical protein